MPEWFFLVFPAWGTLPGLGNEGIRRLDFPMGWEILKIVKVVFP
jgi:hypothetical protein